MRARANPGVPQGQRPLFEADVLLSRAGALRECDDPRQLSLAQLFNAFAVSLSGSPFSHPVRTRLRLWPDVFELDGERFNCSEIAGLTLRRQSVQCQIRGELVRWQMAGWITHPLHRRVAAQLMFDFLSAAERGNAAEARDLARRLKWVRAADLVFAASCLALCTAAFLAILLLGKEGEAHLWPLKCLVIAGAWLGATLLYTLHAAWCFSLRHGTESMGS